jgi:hypothetical protein
MAHVPALKIEVRDTNHDALLKIQSLLDGTEWSPATLDAIALIVRDAGFPIRDLGEAA